SAVDKLDGLALPPGALVAIDVRNPFHHAVLILALAMKGLPSASLQTAFNAEMSGLSPALILTDSYAKHPETVRQVALDESWFVVDPAAPPDFDRLMAMPGFPDERALVRVIFSSGTTGVPKSTGLNSAMIEKRLARVTFTHGGGAVGGLRELCLMGFSTLGGYLATIGALLSGGLCGYAQSPAEALHIIRIFNIDMLIVAVFQLQAILQALGTGRPPPSLHTLIVGGSKISKELLAEARSRLCSNLLFGYGSTEAGTISFAPASALSGEDGAAGFVYPWVTLQAVDEEDRVLPPGREGILRVKSDEQAQYVVDHPDNRLLFRDGFFYPGDVGRIRADGMVFVTGRSAEVINRGGSSVAPDLIEGVLTARPEIKEAAAFGVPMQMGMEDIQAVVVTEGPFDEQELLAYCREKLADKAPSSIRQVASIPRA